MTASTLTPVTPDELIADLEEQITVCGGIDAVRDISRTLGYRRFNSLVLSDDQQTLLAILREHDIALYHPDDIEEYKKGKIDQALGRLSKTIQVLGSAAILSFLCFVISALGYLIGVPAMKAVIGIGYFAVLCSFLALVAVLLVRGSVSAIWTAYPLSGYREKMPLAALATATTLTQRAPVTFTVEEFRVKRELLDPLLIANFGTARFCIAVWDEPGFTAPLLH